MSFLFVQWLFLNKRYHPNQVQRWVNLFRIGVLFDSCDIMLIVWVCFTFVYPQSACQAAAAYCKEKGKNISNLAMQYSLSNKDISSVLVGMNSIRQVSILH